MVAQRLANSGRERRWKGPNAKVKKTQPEATPEEIAGQARAEKRRRWVRRRQLSDLFALLDQSNKGRLERADVRRTLHMVGMHATDADVDSLLAKIGKASDSGVTVDEFITMMEVAAA